MQSAPFPGTWSKAGWEVTGRLFLFLISTVTLLPTVTSFICFMPVTFAKTPDGLTP